MTVYRRKEDDNPLPLLLGCSTRSIRMAIDTLARDRTDVGEREGGALEGSSLDEFYAKRIRSLKGARDA
jgi:hypothetical protein